MWMIDPTTKQPSVSLTQLVASFTMLVVLGGLQVFKVIDGVGIFSELFYASVALYFSRRMTFGKDTRVLEKDKE